MVVERFGEEAAALGAALTAHAVVEGPDFVVPERQRPEGLVVAVADGGGIDVVSGEEVLGLDAEFGFHVVEGEPFAGLEPGVIGEVGGRAMVHVNVDGPVSEDEVGVVLVEEEFGELFVALAGEFGGGAEAELAHVAAGVVQTVEADLEDFGGFGGVEAVAHGAVLAVGAGEGRGSAGEGEADDIMALIGEEG